MRSSHHIHFAGGCETSKRRRSATYPEQIEVFKLIQIINNHSPPARGREPVGIHPSHIAHANEADDEVLHARWAGVLACHCEVSAQQSGRIKKWLVNPDVATPLGYEEYPGLEALG